ncbi:hypothetical protein BD309DRAFT_962461 [Dichomitus squalens]|uniref:Uncharacterized protein n=1 Tax=Dichomitus squalens TaxID=114155 RepID=A0A4Q9PVR0_9APHY|nr:hypothetical protein BD309DRAFT_962461 [Dichomitus squalens]TBU58673.1 hypothetical protein BD310DRAFT_926713 [Dichomitus squalens]
MTRRFAGVCQPGYKQFITEAAPDVGVKSQPVLLGLVDDDRMDGVCNAFNGVYRRCCLLVFPLCLWHDCRPSPLAGRRRSRCGLGAPPPCALTVGHRDDQSGPARRGVSGCEAPSESGSGFCFWLSRRRVRESLPAAVLGLRKHVTNASTQTSE